ncbi:CLIP domain-containing serine protease B4-like [Anopheles ziemanni]|uniref:CLIP domain-containing serine protease B4-like n=1 Tax=Anopheles coustani TaxID=139045 RepID=UPI00265A86FA|nr:CLIP domain-containing serine protease B4-like [Anopheles coustani]XP_058169085.1 CLIP domain-containing serine protease B4-like [Anopheles ziemanni]
MWLCGVQKVVITDPPTTLPPASGALPEPPMCGLQVADRIVGGEVTEPDEFPWTALIEYKKRDGTFGLHCGGSLINERHVLTAAHCVTELPHGWTVHRVRLGEWDVSSDPDCYQYVNNSEPECFASSIDLEPFKIIKHNGYDTRDASKANDIALIRFARAVEYTDTVRPICLPVSQALRRKDHTGMLAWAAGWGKTESNSRSDIKLKVNLTINSLQQCSPAYRRNGIALKPVHLCAGGKHGKDTCTGDSGGPLMRSMAGTWYLLGVVSYGPAKCGSSGVSGIYVNVAEYIDWIQENII